MNEEYTSIILEDLYDISLRAALRVIDNYEKFKKKSFVSKKLKEKDFIYLYLNGTLHFLSKSRKITPTFKYNVLTMLNDIRLNYQFSNSEEKSYINQKINETIILINSCEVFDDVTAKSLKEDESISLSSNSFFASNRLLDMFSFSNNFISK